jgi:hypothetical protein
MLDRQREQRAQPLSYLLARHALAEPYGVDLEALAEVGERVADITDGAASAGQGRRLTLICEAGRVELSAGRVALTAHGSRTRVASATPSPLSSLRYRFNPPKEQ